MTLHEWLFSLFPAPGFYVEAGAHDGVGDSATKALEDRGWSGICVEPSSAFAGLKANRRCAVDNRCLWRCDDQMVEFSEVPGNQIELSGITQCFADHWDRSAGVSIDKPTVSLPTLLKEHAAPNVIQFMSLDTEGSEYQILLGHDFSKYHLLTLLVEHNGVEVKRDAVRGLLAVHGYQPTLDNPSAAIEDRFVHVGAWDHDRHKHRH